LDYLTGDYRDFSPDWYNDVGMKLSGSILGIAFSPLIEILVDFIIQYIMRVIDSRSLCPRRTLTHSSTISKYVSLYSGPDYVIHIRYSYMINLFWVVVIFGQVMPILYFYGLLGLIILYVTERLTLAYMYKVPP
jgi:hypothetical protein